jgi:MFS family permease
MLSLFFFSVVPDLALVPVATVLYGTGQGIIIPSIQGTIAARSPLELRGATMSVNAMAIRIGQTLGPLFTGLIYSLGGIVSVFRITAALAMCMIAVTAASLSSGTAVAERKRQ